MQRIAEGVKLDTALTPTTGATSLTGPWFSMEGYRRALFALMAADQTNGQSFTFSVYEATDADGSDESQLGASITVSQGVKVSKATVKCTNVSVGDTLKIKLYKVENGELAEQTELTFTAAAGETLADREFDQDTSDNATATSLAACINDETYGVDGLTAVAATDTVTLTVTDPGAGVFTITELAAAVARLVVTDKENLVYFEVDAKDLDRDDDFTHIGARVASVDATTEFACALLRAEPRYAKVIQAVSGYDDSE
jgi:hypothetical protein